MSLDKPPKNKMMQSAPAKKGFHFASDGVYAATYIEAETIEEATAQYHKVKQFISPTRAEGSHASSTPAKPKTSAIEGVQ